MTSEQSPIATWEPVQGGEWDQGKAVSLGWTHDERLVALNDEGTYRIHDLAGTYTQHSLGTDAADIGILDARIHEHGLVALTNQLTFLEVKGWTGVKPLALALPDPPLDGAPHGWSLVPPDAAISRHIEVLVASGNTILSVDALECVDQRVGRGPFLAIAPSPNGKSVALLTSAGLIWVVSADFSKSFAEYDSTQDSQSLPRQVVWCGNDAVVLSYSSGQLIILGPFGDTIKHYYPGAPHVIGEVDGARVVCIDRCDWIQKVPPSSMNALGPTSTHPAALLLHAAEQFAQRVPSAHDSVNTIRPELVGAVDTLIDAAGREWEGAWQRKLMSAAAFGRAFLDMYDPTDFVTMGKTLKVLNAARYYEIGIPITFAQYQHTSATHLIARLTARNEHLLALRVAEFLGHPPDAVLKHWACAKIAKSGKMKEETDTAPEAADGEVCRAIVDKFKTIPGASFADIAKKAWELGRGRLATMLLDYEPRAGEQVPLLLQMKEDRVALIKAVDSGDTDLVYLVLLKLKKQSSLGDFFRLLEEGGPAFGPAVRLLEVYAREQDRELLRDFYYQDDKRVSSALLALEDARDAKLADNRVECVRTAAKFLSEDRERNWEAKAMDDSVRLLTYQQQLEKDFEGRVECVGASVNETIRICLVNGQPRKAEKVRAEWKVPDKRYATTSPSSPSFHLTRLPIKRYWYIKLYAYTETRDWDGLETFAKSKRSPIGYEPFVAHLVSQGYAKQASSYVGRCDGPKRADLYVKCEEWRLAGEECKARGEKAKLEQIRKGAPNNLVGRELDQILSTMR
ncbi:hypothetical protein FRC09_003726 [Ceratobasidium sp. 395]|nr:hypothetical protein FRC09_003726 [Ceratobasidium sp. 395]